MPDETHTPADASAPAGTGLETRRLTVRYGGVVANEAISLTVEPGEIVGLIGPNGAGKTTFVDAVTGFTPAEGDVLLDGESLTGMPPHRRRRAGLSRTWQSGELFPNLTVRQNVTVSLRPGGLRAVLGDLFGRHSTDVDTIVDTTLEAVGLAGLGAMLARDLTLGQQKLVGVARALAGTCSVLLLDEPAAGLDTRESTAFADRIRAVADSGRGILLIDHDMSLILSVCTRLYVVEFGKIIFSGTPSEARTDPAVVAAYLGTPMEPIDV
ncbi:ABC transporter ATP-binding protein [Rhodococcus sp. NPDC047139]|uniref:ABC transporter ATP-binding protein n=1 Tax=Rhodococcus sp. NPDC047139 TaxID=3155141 RepID=UPI0033D62D6A